MADKEEIQLAWVLLEEWDHGVIRDEDLIREFKGSCREVLLISLRDIICNLIAGAWNNLSSPHWVLASAHHVEGSRLLAPT